VYRFLCEPKSLIIALILNSKTLKIYFPSEFSYQLSYFYFNKQSTMYVCMCVHVCFLTPANSPRLWTPTIEFNSDIIYQELAPDSRSLRAQSYQTYPSSDANHKSWPTCTSDCPAINWGFQWSPPHVW
jgi:hypothetical protein